MGGGVDIKWSLRSVYAGKVVHAETTVAHAVLNGSHYYHQDWAHAAAHVIAPPLRIEPNTPGYLMGLLGKYVLITGVLSTTEAFIFQEEITTLRSAYRQYNKSQNNPRFQ